MFGSAAEATFISRRNVRPRLVADVPRLVQGAEVNDDVARGIPAALAVEPPQVGRVRECVIEVCVSPFVPPAVTSLGHDRNRSRSGTRLAIAGLPASRPGRS